MTREQRNLVVLVGAQALLFINNATILAVNGVTGRQLALDNGYGAELATLPVTAWVLGGALAAYPAAMLMRKVGRRVGFSLGAAGGLLGALLAMIAMQVQGFVLLTLASLLVGAYNAFGLQYRFAAADAVPDAAKARAMGYVMSAGLLGGFIGPEVSRLSKDVLIIPYAGIYLTLAGFTVLALGVLQGLRMARHAPVAASALPRSLRAIVRQPLFIATVFIAAISHGIMSLVMTATTLTMTSVCGFSYGIAARTLGTHLVAMFGPSFFTGILIQRFGELRLMLVGCALFAVAMLIAINGVDLGHFWLALALLGLGWNLLYLPASSLLTRTYRNGEGPQAQGFNEAMVFAAMVLASFFSGYLLRHLGWAWLNRLALMGTGLVVCVVTGLLLVRTRTRVSA